MEQGGDTRRLGIGESEGGRSALVNGCCARCGCFHDERDVEITELGHGRVRVWCLSCGAYFDAIVDFRVQECSSYQQASA